VSRDGNAERSAISGTNARRIAPSSVEDVAEDAGRIVCPEILVVMDK
jgi:hypothetical protein